MYIMLIFIYRYLFFNKYQNLIQYNLIHMINFILKIKLLIINLMIQYWMKMKQNNILNYNKFHPNLTKLH